MKFRTMVSVCAVVLLATAAGAYGDWMKMDPPPDVDKSAHGHTGTGTCWLATAANMLAGAGYGTGATVQARADNIYNQLVAHFGTSGGWTDTALSWWLGSSHNTDPGNPYDVVTVYGNKTRTPWTNSNGAKFIGNELRRCQMAGLSISWPRTSSGGSPSGGHAIACWGDSGSEGTLTSNPSQVIVVDSDRDTGGDVQKYTYDSYTNPNPSGHDEGNGWYINYSTNHPFIKHIITLCPTDNPGDHTRTQKVTGSYRIHQNNRKMRATDLHYRVGTDVDILSYKTTINWSTANKPVISEYGSPPRNLTVDWDLRDNPVPYCTWVTITTEFVVPTWNAISYSDVYFTYPEIGILFPSFRWEIYTPIIDKPTAYESVSGGYVVGSFDLVDIKGEQPEVLGEYRFMHEYDFDQDPEQHQFQLMPVEAMGYYVANIRLGHSYGQLAEEELWAFDDWITRVPEMRLLDQQVVLSVDWEGRLPYPQGENYRGQYEPLECSEYLPGDLNRDCCVNFKDVAIVANDWLVCTYSYKPN